jgi:hypothetical protein
LQRDGIGYQVEVLDALLLFNGVTGGNRAIAPEVNPINKAVVSFDLGGLGHKVLSQGGVGDVFQ